MSWKNEVFKFWGQEVINADDFFKKIEQNLKNSEQKKAEKLGNGISPIIANILAQWENNNPDTITIDKIEKIIHQYNIPKYFVIIIFLYSKRLKPEDIIKFNLTFEEYYNIFINYYGDKSEQLKEFLLKELERLSSNQYNLLEILKLPYSNATKDKLRDKFINEVNDIKLAQQSLWVMFMNINHNYEQFWVNILEKMNKLIIWILKNIENVDDSEKFSFICSLVRYFRKHDFRTDYILFITEYLSNWSTQDFLKLNEKKIQGFEEMYGQSFAKVFRILPKSPYDIINFMNQIVYIDNDTKLVWASDYWKVKISEFVFRWKKTKEIYKKLITKLKIDSSIVWIIQILNIYHILGDKNNFNRYFDIFLKKIETEWNFTKFIKETESFAGKWICGYDNSFIKEISDTSDNPTHIKLMNTLNNITEDSNFFQWEYLFRHTYLQSFKLLYFLKMLNIISNNKDHIESFRVYVYRMKDILAVKWIDTNKFEKVYSWMDLDKANKDFQNKGELDNALNEELSISILVNARNIKDLFSIYTHSINIKLKELAFNQAVKVLNILE